MPLKMKYFLYIFLLLITPCLKSAEITFKAKDTGFSDTPHGVPNGDYVIYLSGKIEQKDVIEFQKTLKKISSQVKTESNNAMDRMLILNSGGGSVSSAIKIGELIRKNKMFVVVREQEKCFSSCVYLLAAGVIRWPLGNIGIHRPYFESKPGIGYDQGVKFILDSSRNYFKEMNIPEQLADEMFSIDPGDMRILEENDLLKYRLNKYDIAHSEELSIENSKLYGISRQEYERRLKLSEHYYMECRKKYTENYAESKDDISKIIIICKNFSYKKAGLSLK